MEGSAIQSIVVPAGAFLAFPPLSLRMSVKPLAVLDVTYR